MAEITEETKENHPSEQEFDEDNWLMLRALQDGKSEWVNIGTLPDWYFDLKPRE